ncbi:unnamed protein product [Zymoseptoria tritici ST99CH_3D7]|uniref:Uncharacterized protein n=1 Tax=Zymoseptoria tritici (strain ST99CH_3D7) TaxID=1276538 RepID=A0A1X7S7G2_ZYMT9|nr:unnamed protein product [Zymoseptoria tritici ST99CH_3D7]
MEWTLVCNFGHMTARQNLGSDGDVLVPSQCLGRVITDYAHEVYDVLWTWLSRHGSRQLGLHESRLIADLVLPSDSELVFPVAKCACRSVLWILNKC